MVTPGGSVAAEMEFCLLGPLQVRLSGNVVPVPAGAQRVLLATLLLRANSVVSADDLADVLWPSGPPRSARASLHNTVLRLRRSLGAEGYARVVANCGGYQIRIGAGELDVDAFESLLARARVAKAIGPDSEAAALRAALSLWRGKPLSGVSSEVLDLREVPRLEEMRLQALAARIDADVRLERYDEAIIELRQLTAAYPLREHLHALLMLALDRPASRGAGGLSRRPRCARWRAWLRAWRGVAPPAAGDPGRRQTRGSRPESPRRRRRGTASAAARGPAFHWPVR